MKKYFFKEDGQGLIEYGLIVGLVSIISVASLGFFSTSVIDKYSIFDNALSTEQMADGSYLITTEDGVYIQSSLGWLKGPYTGDKGDIVIPKSLNGFSVKEIYQDVFKGKSLTQVIFDAGSSIVRIHARAFQDNNLSSITLPDGLQRIDLYAFRDNNLSQITIPSSVTKIEGSAFEGNDIRSVTIGGGVSSFGSNVFSNNNEGFKTAYASGGAGTYIYTDGQWKKQK